MLASVPKLFGRGFLVGFMLPAAFFLAYLVYGLGLDPVGLGSANGAAPEAVGRAAIAIAGLGLLLLVVNRPIVRGLEGYGRLNPLRLGLSWQRKRFDAATSAAKAAKDKLADASARPTSADTDALAALVERFPHEGRWLLPTRFGNVYRAYESYPLVIYNIDAVLLWPRMLCVIPELALEQLRNARALFDFKVNSFVLSLVGGFVALGTWSSWAHGVCGVLSFALAVWLWVTLPAAVATWGDAFTSTFDLYRAVLAKKLGLKLPTELKTERSMWSAIAKMIRFRSSENAEYLDQFRLREAPTAETATPAGDGLAAESDD
ncbi:MAG TPA: hypothetical protein VEA61_12660 [Allosphingosinicella sp.]|nr:hypothetical protein [Allosphingosinicella sp.]